MGKIDTSEWKEFRIKDLFETQKKGNKLQVPTGASVPVQDLLEDGATPRITVTGSNNGIFGFYDYCGKNIADYRVFNNFVSVSFLGTVFYQEGDATLDMKVHCLKPKGITLNKYTGRFLVGAIRASLRESTYSDQISSSILPEMSIKLPSTLDGAPDWAYMESYMANLETKVAKSLTLLQAAKDAEKKKVDTREWGEFRVGELFEVKISKSVDKGGLEFAEDGEYDFIGRTPLNNGIQGRLNKLKFEANQEGTYSIAQIGMHVCQYRERKWYASQNIFILTPFAEKSHKANKFIATVITRYLDCAYGEDTYATYPTAKTLPHLKIKLPVDKTGQPDWTYMEEYMRKVEERVKVMMAKYEMTVNEAAL